MDKKLNIYGVLFIILLFPIFSFSQEEIKATQISQEAEAKIKELKNKHNIVIYEESVSPDKKWILYGCASSLILGQNIPLIG